MFHISQDRTPRYKSSSHVPSHELACFLIGTRFHAVGNPAACCTMKQGHGMQREQSSSCQRVIPALASMKEPVGLKDEQAKLKRHAINDKQVVAPIAVVGSHTVI